MTPGLAQALVILGVALIATGLFGIWYDRRK
jgi:hypothetical protein